MKTSSEYNIAWIICHGCAWRLGSYMILEPDKLKIVLLTITGRFVDILVKVCGEIGRGGRGKRNKHI